MRTAAATSAPPRASRPERCIASRRRRTRERQDEARPRRPILEGEVAVHAPRELAADREAQAEPALARVRPAREALEDPLAILSRHAGTAVLHDDPRHAVGQLRPGPDRIPRGPVLQRVVEQDADDLSDASRIADRPDGVAVVELDLLPPLAGAQLQLGGDGPQDRADLDQLAAQRNARVD